MRTLQLHSCCPLRGDGLLTGGGLSSRNSLAAEMPCIGMPCLWACHNFYGMREMAAHNATQHGFTSLSKP